MLAVDGQLAFAVDLGQVGPRDHGHGVPQSLFRRVPMLEGFGPLAGQVQMQRAPMNQVQQVQALVYRQER